MFWSVTFRSNLYSEFFYCGIRVIILNKFHPNLIPFVSMCSNCFCCYIRNLDSVSTVLRVLKPWAVEKSILRDVLKPNKAMFETTDD